LNLAGIVKKTSNEIKLKKSEELLQNMIEIDNADI
jgi:hypothetical protein